MQPNGNGSWHETHNGFKYAVHDGGRGDECAGAWYQSGVVHPRDHARRRAAQRRTGIQNPGGLEDVFNASQRHGILPQQARCARERAKLPLGGRLLGQVQAEKDDSSPGDANALIQKRQNLRLHQDGCDCVFQPEDSGVIKRHT